jgi:hypothetical protein
MRFVFCLTLLASVALPGATDAQAVARQFTVAPRAGYIRFDRASSIENGGFVGVDAMYNVTSMFSLGASASWARANTRGEDFVAALTFGDPTVGDTTFYFHVTQPLSVVTYEAVGVARLPLAAARLTPFLMAGAGAYTVYMDPQITAGPRKMSHFGASIGGGVEMRLGQRSGLRFDVRDQIFTKFDRDRLNPTDPRFTAIAYPEDFPVPPTAKETLHNLSFSFGFTFTPSGAGVEETEEGQQ